MREPPDYSHYPEVKNYRNPDYRKIKGQKPWSIHANYRLDILAS